MMMSLSRRVLRDTPVQDDKVTLVLSPLDEAIARSEQMPEEAEDNKDGSSSEPEVATADEEVPEVEPALTPQQIAEQEAAERANRT